jgi:hypothetical protein
VVEEAGVSGENKLTILVVIGNNCINVIFRQVVNPTTIQSWLPTLFSYSWFIFDILNSREFLL